MPKFFLACRVRAVYHIEIDAKNLADAKRKAEASIIDRSSTTPRSWR